MNTRRAGFIILMFGFVSFVSSAQAEISISCDGKNVSYVGTTWKQYHHIKLGQGLSFTGTGDYHCNAKFEGECHFLPVKIGCHMVSENAKPGKLKIEAAKNFVVIDGIKVTYPAKTITVKGDKGIIPINSKKIDVYINFEGDVVGSKEASPICCWYAKKGSTKEKVAACEKICEKKRAKRFGFIIRYQKS